MAKKKKKSGNGVDRTKNGPTNKRPTIIKPEYPSSEVKRISLGQVENDLKSGCNQLLKTYPYVICCGMGKIVSVHGCYEHELENEYHWVVEQTYSKHFGSPYKLVNSSHPSNKVCPQDQILKSISISKKKKSNFAEFGGGQYDYMIIAYSPFEDESNDDGVIKVGKEGQTHSGHRGQDLVKRKDYQKRHEGEIVYYESSRGYYQKIDGKLKYLGTKLKTV